MTKVTELLEFTSQDVSFSNWCTSFEFRPSEYQVRMNNFIRSSCLQANKKRTECYQYFRTLHANLKKTGKPSDVNTQLNKHITDINYWDKIYLELIITPNEGHKKILDGSEKIDDYIIKENCGQMLVDNEVPTGQIQLCSYLLQKLTDIIKAYKELREKMETENNTIFVRDLSIAQLQAVLESMQNNST